MITQARRKEGSEREKDDWDVICVNHDVAVMLRVQAAVGSGPRKRKEWKQVWRMANVVGMRVVASEPSDNADSAALQAAEVAQPRPREISLDDPKAVLSVRWYVECDKHGEAMPGSYEHKKQKPNLAWFYLPIMAESFAEPVTLISNKCVVEAVLMSKVPGYQSVWKADPEHYECATEAFKGRSSNLNTSAANARSHARQQRKRKR